MPDLNTVISALVKPPKDGKYSHVVPNSTLEGRSAVYRHHRFSKGPLTSLDPNIRTLHEAFEISANRNPRNRCLGWRDYDPITKTWGSYQWMDYATVQQRRANLGVGLVEALSREGVARGKYGVGLWCQNRPEWQITDLACLSQSLFTVSLYDTLGPATTEYIINHAELVCIATSLSHIPTLLRLKPRLPSLKVIISLDPIESSNDKEFDKLAILNAMGAGVKIYSMQQVEALGIELSNGQPRYTPPSPNDIVTINYTSGTTGDPKGVVHVHSAAVAAASATLLIAPVKPSDTGLSYLPLAHIYERVTENGCMMVGAGVGYFHGDILDLVDDLKTLKPDVFISVPRLYNRFGGAVKAATVEQSGIKGSLARHIVNTKTAAMIPPDAPSSTNKHAIYDRVWGRKVAAALGLQNVRNMVSGAAPLDPSLHRFFRAVLGNNFVQGYGLTETYAHGVVQSQQDMSVGNCGGVSACVEVCLMDVPDMEYFATDKPNPRGEILLRGPSVFKGYFRNDAETAKTILPDGWFRTGDVGSVDSRGRFQIIDRVKNVLKLAQGEYISPERLENVYLSSLSYLAMGFIHGDSVQTHLVGIFAVQADFFVALVERVTKRKIAVTDVQGIKAACVDAQVLLAVKADLDQVGRENKFAGYEKVKVFRLMVDPFTIENDLLTPTLKLKRPVAAKKYRALIDGMYSEGGKAKL